MNTPPPTDTPAPLSDDELREMLDRVARFGEWAALDAPRIAATILALRARNEAHVAALQEIGRGVEADQATIARLREELAQADAVIFDQYEGPVDAHNDPQHHANMNRWIPQAIERHRARHSAGTEKYEAATKEHK